MNASLKQRLAVAAFVLFCLIMGLVVGGQALSSQASPQPIKEAEAAPAVTPKKPQPPDGPRVSQGIEPRGWIDLDRSDLEDLMSLPGMTRNRALAIIGLRKQKPDLKPEDLLTLPGITQSDLDSWKPFLWEKDEEAASSGGRP